MRRSQGCRVRAPTGQDILNVGVAASRQAMPFNQAPLTSPLHIHARCPRPFSTLPIATCAPRTRMLQAPAALPVLLRGIHALPPAHMHPPLAARGGSASESPRPQAWTQQPPREAPPGTPAAVCGGGSGSVEIGCVKCGTNAGGYSTLLAQTACATLARIYCYKISCSLA